MVDLENQSDSYLDRLSFTIPLSNFYENNRKNIIKGLGCIAVICLAGAATLAPFVSIQATAVIGVSAIVACGAYCCLNKETLSDHGQEGNNPISQLNNNSSNQFNQLAGNQGQDLPPKYEEVAKEISPPPYDDAIRQGSNSLGSEAQQISSTSLSLNK